MAKASDDDDEPHISPHAIQGSKHPRTMQIEEFIHPTKRSLRILVDSGSTHNFIDSSLAAALNLLVEKNNQIRVAVVNGERVQSSGICRNVCLFLGDYTSNWIFMLCL